MDETTERGGDSVLFSQHGARPLLGIFWKTVLVSLRVSWDSRPAVDGLQGCPVLGVVSTGPASFSGGAVRSTVPKSYLVEKAMRPGLLEYWLNHVTGCIWI